ncbi:MAG: family 43 glycosylhydrolase [Verrucomicrobia bacterium]|nr:family 43 glycosylhydrolase [Verrucomicrobiota bacterium]
MFRSALVLAAVATGAWAAPAPTYCNPLNLDYGSGLRSPRHSADPVIVRFQERYYLFATEDVPGYRVSEDLVHWRRVEFPRDLWSLTSDRGGGLYCAPAVAADAGHLYFIRMERRTAVKAVPVLRSADPAAGRWEKCGELRPTKDPALFFDDGRAWLYHGLAQPTRVFEIDRKTWTEIPGSERQLRAEINDVTAFVGGYERGRRELLDETDTAAWLGRFGILPCQEAAWMTKHRGRYYLQYATPGTVSAWYCDTVMEGDSPIGPFRHVDYAPVSLKVGGFMGSAGHSSVFSDASDRLWRATTMWIGVHDLFERRLGLFPVGFDPTGRMFTDTALGDYPRRASDGRLAGWWVQSFGRPCAASSSLADHPPTLAADENCRTWWSARTGNAGEWFEIDLERPRRVQAIQVNFADQDLAAKVLAPGEAGYRYRLLGSNDGRQWRVLADRSAAPGTGPHDYVELAGAGMWRRLRVENIFTPGQGKFALSDLRVFGHGGGDAPPPPRLVEVRRHTDDDRNATLSWTPAAGADGYLIRFGVAPDALHLAIQVQGGAKGSLTTHALTRGVSYAWRVDAFNANGLTVGRVWGK